MPQKIDLPTGHRKLDLEEMEFDGSGAKDIPVWGWALIGIAGAAVVGGAGFGIYKLCTRTPAPPVDFSYIPISKGAAADDLASAWIDRGYKYEGNFIVGGEKCWGFSRPGMQQ